MSFDIFKSIFGEALDISEPDPPAINRPRHVVTIEELINRGRSVVRVKQEYYRITVERISAQEAKSK